ncbi:MAG: M20 family metallopeptidase [Erysipelothrix sp.]|nr:M20 family metallopeptidase [Erysipelothrix sp.]
MKDIIKSYANKQFPVYQEIAQNIHAKPEVSNYEFYACEVLSEQLKKEGFDVKVNVAGHRTGFDARYTSSKPGPVIAFLAEYDALQGIGHACGHNIFGATSLLAAASLKQVIDDIGGEIRVYGTPGEEGGENGSAKGSFVREGFLKDVDAALCVHPGYKHTLSGPSLANDPVDVEFFGRASHAAAQPEHGINALDAVLNVYSSINALREHLPSDVRIHGIITHGGDAPNVVPEYASARFYLRALTRPTLNDVYTKFENIVKAAALATGCTYKFGLFQNSVDNTVVTPLFDALYERNLIENGETLSNEESALVGGSSDVGNISQVVPVIQPTISISDTPITPHAIDFMAASISPRGIASIELGATLLAQTAFDLITNPDLLNEIKEQHQLNVLAQD